MSFKAMAANANLPDKMRSQEQLLWPNQPGLVGFEALLHNGGRELMSVIIDLVRSPWLGRPQAMGLTHYCCFAKWMQCHTAF